MEFLQTKSKGDGIEPFPFYVRFCTIPSDISRAKAAGMFGGLVFADKSQVYATLRTETRANTVEMLHIKNFNDSPMSV
jgi:hypothetical protein